MGNTVSEDINKSNQRYILLLLISLNILNNYFIFLV